MKTIGLIGGLSWESSKEYYRIINETVNERLGGLHSAKCILYSLDFAESREIQQTKGWDEMTKILIDTAQRLEAAGADIVLICTNTMHKFMPEIQREIHVPILHIADATAEKVLEKGLKKVGLLGTKMTMEEDFYKGRIGEKFGINVLVPDKDERDFIETVIIDELCVGKMNASSKKRFKQIIGKLVENGVEGIILGCTEIPLLIKQEDVNVPIFDTAEIHAKAAVEFALK
ncbi:MAG: aspartate/glutamate racemase family protein [Candidatus Bathyarchaeia archaeon]